MNTPAIPDSLKHLPVFRGLAVPVTVVRNPVQFAAVDTREAALCGATRHCGMCGQPMGEDMWAIYLKPLGSRFRNDRRKATAADVIACAGAVSRAAPMHLECSRYASAACPFLSRQPVITLLQYETCTLEGVDGMPIFRMRGVLSVVRIRNRRRAP